MEKQMINCTHKLTFTRNLGFNKSVFGNNYKKYFDKINEVIRYRNSLRVNGEKTIYGYAVIENGEVLGFFDAINGNYIEEIFLKTSDNYCIELLKDIKNSKFEMKDRDFENNLMCTHKLVVQENDVDKFNEIINQHYEAYNPSLEQMDFIEPSIYDEIVGYAVRDNDKLLGFYDLQRDIFLSGDELMTLHNFEIKRANGISVIKTKENKTPKKIKRKQREVRR